MEGETKSRNGIERGLLNVFKVRWSYRAFASRMKCWSRHDDSRANTSHQIISQFMENLWTRQKAQNGIRDTWVVITFSRRELNAFLSRPEKNRASDRKSLRIDCFFRVECFCWTVQQIPSKNRTSRGARDKKCLSCLCTFRYAPSISSSRILAMYHFFASSSSRDFFLLPFHVLCCD